LPHLVMLPVLIRFWNWKETALVTGFSLVVVSLYLGIEITLISGLPFSSSLDELRTTSKSIAIQFYWFIALAFPTILQGILFRYWWTALLSAIVLSVLTWLVVRWNLGSLEKEMRWKLHTMKMGQNRTFQVLD
jgi:uncharacterized membrane protein YvlD (DUF360 family)